TSWTGPSCSASGSVPRSSKRSRTTERRRKADTVTDTNPFGGGFDVNALLQQAQAMQEQMVAAQQELAEAEVDGTVADGLVTVTVNGTGELIRVKIRANSFDPADTEDLEDLIVAAYRDARGRSDEMA